MTVFYNFSGGMESAAMLVIERERIKETGAIVRWADTGKQFPEMADSIKQIEAALDLKIITVPRRITFEEFLYDRGCILRKGLTDCSRRMKRGNLVRHMKTFGPPYEVNLGFHAGERDRADKFSDLNNKPRLTFRYPLIERGVHRAATWGICEKAGFAILVEMYRKMGRFDCFWCPNQSPRQALRVVDHYPELAQEWMETEIRKGHSILPIPLRVLIEQRDRQGLLDFRQSECACFGGNEEFDDSDE